MRAFGFWSLRWFVCVVICMLAAHDIAMLLKLGSGGAALLGITVGWTIPMFLVGPRDTGDK